MKGAIVIARYGGSWRGIKPKVAAEHGAVGCLIYSDPHDDGYSDGDVFPQAPAAARWRAARQRHGYAGISGRPADARDRRNQGGQAAAPQSGASTLTKIPVLPISYGDAEPLLAALTGPVAPQAWRGALPITYHVGPGPAKVHLKLEFNWDIKTVYDVIARIPGSDFRMSGSSAATITTPG